MHGAPLTLGSAAAAHHAGLRFIHQDLGLVADARRGRQPRPGPATRSARWWLSAGAESAPRRAELLAELYPSTSTSTAPVSELSRGRSGRSSRSPARWAAASQRRRAGPRRADRLASRRASTGRLFELVRAVAGTAARHPVRHPPAARGLPARRPRDRAAGRPRVADAARSRRSRTSALVEQIVGRAWALLPGARRATDRERRAAVEGPARPLGCATLHCAVHRGEIARRHRARRVGPRRAGAGARRGDRRRGRLRSSAAGSEADEPGDADRPGSLTSRRPQAGERIPGAPLART